MHEVILAMARFRLVTITAVHEPVARAGLGRCSERMFAYMEHFEGELGMITSLDRIRTRIRRSAVFTERGRVKSHH